MKFILEELTSKDALACILVSVVLLFLFFLYVVLRDAAMCKQAYDGSAIVRNELSDTVNILVVIIGSK